MWVYLICILIHLKSIFINFQHFWNFDFLLLFLQNPVEGAVSDFQISDSSWSPSAVRHTVRSAAKNEYQSYDFQPILWHESKVMTKKWFWPTHFSQNQVAALSSYLLISYFFDFWKIGHQARGTSCPRVGGTSAGILGPLPFKMLSKNPSRQSLVRE